MKDEPLVSIALCTYNGEKYISQQLNSIINQTYRSLEIIIVDDCSSDDTYNIISNYAQNDSRIKCFKNEANIGFNKNFEYAIKLTTGEYIAISDQDDIWLPMKIESLLNHIGDNWLIFSNSVFVNSSNEVMDGKMLHTYNIATNKYMHNYKSILLSNFITGHTMLFKKEFIDYFSPFPEKGFYDWWMGFVALYHQKILFLNEILTHYRVHETSVMQGRIKLGQEKLNEAEAIDHMLSAFASYTHLENVDRAFITHLRDAYKLNLFQKVAIPLIKIIFNNYCELFVNHKIRKRLSLLNFAIKYARKARKHVRHEEKRNIN
jgi:glycosyltransferase involved in cell wall biosynthesis